MAGFKKMLLRYKNKSKNFVFIKGYRLRIKNLGLKAFFIELSKYYKRYHKLIHNFGYKPSFNDQLKWDLFVIYDYARYCYLNYEKDSQFILDCVPMGFAYYKYWAKKIGHFEYLYQQNDKIEFYRLCEINNIPFPRVYFFSRYGRLFDLWGNELEDINEFHLKKAFVKDLNGANGSEARVVNITEKDIDLTKELIYQEIAVNHHQIKKLAPVEAFNTIRIQSYRNRKNDIEYNCAFFKFSRGALADNISAGGFGVGITVSDGKLMEFGLNEYVLDKVTKHPDSNIPFAKFEIPFWKETLEIVERFHFVFGGRWIGWDIGITDTGPVFVEGNSGGGMLFQQSSSRPFYNDDLIQENIQE